MLLTTADLAARRGRADDARAALRRGLELHPDDLDLRLALATLELGTDRPDEAADCLEEGRKLLKDAEAGAGPVRADQFAGRGPAAAGADEARGGAGRRGPQGRRERHGRLPRRPPGDVPRPLGNGGAGAGRLRQDLRHVRGPGACVPCFAPRRVTNVSATATVVWARCGRPWAWRPSSASGRRRTGAALLDAGRTDEALDELRGVTALPQAPEEAWALLARALLLHNQALPRDRRDWPEVDRALDRAGASPEAGAAAGGGAAARDEPGRGDGRAGTGSVATPGRARRLDGTWPSTRPAGATRPGRRTSWRTPGGGSATGWNFGWPPYERAPARKAKRPCHRPFYGRWNRYRPNSSAI